MEQSSTPRLASARAHEPKYPHDYCRPGRDLLMYGHEVRVASGLVESNQSTPEVGETVMPHPPQSATALRFSKADGRGAVFGFDRVVCSRPPICCELCVCFRFFVQDNILSFVLPLLTGSREVAVISEPPVSHTFCEITSCSFVSVVFSFAADCFHMLLLAAGVPFERN